MIKTTRGKAVTLHISRMLLHVNNPKKGNNGFNSLSSVTAAAVETYKYRWDKMGF